MSLGAGLNDERATLWRCTKCMKWSHAQRRPSSHTRLIKDGAPADHNAYDGTPARQVAFASGYKADDVLEEEGPRDIQTAVDDFDEIPGHVIVRCGPFEKWIATRETPEATF